MAQAEALFTCRIRPQHVNKRFEDVRVDDREFVRWVLRQNEIRNNNLRAFAQYCRAADDTLPRVTTGLSSADTASSHRMNHRMNHRRKKHAEYFRDHCGIELVACEHVDDYRAAVESLVRSDDLALEVGCAGGNTTRILGRRCRMAYGVDKSFSPGMLAEQQRHAQQSNVNFEQLDATDLGALLRLSQRVAREAAKGSKEEGSEGAEVEADSLPTGFSVILVDISGSAKLSAVLDLIERYESCFKGSLRLLLIKSFRFACLLDRAATFEDAAASGAA